MSASACVECAVCVESELSSRCVAEHTVLSAPPPAVPGQWEKVTRHGGAVRPAVLSEHSRSEQTDSQQNTLTLADRTVQSGRTLRAAGLRTDGTAARKVSKVEIKRALARTRADNIAENWPLAEHEEQSEADSVLSLSVTGIMRKQMEHDVLKMKNNSNLTYLIL